MSRLRLGLALLLLMAAGSSIAASEASAQRAEALRIPFPQEDGTLTPYTFELGYPLVTLVYDTLMWRDTGGTPRPWLARSVESSAGRRVWTVQLRRGVRWHDGRPLTAADVAFTFQFIGVNRHPRFTPQVADVQSVETRGRYTVVFRLRRPSLGFLDQPLADVPIVPRHRWQGLPLARLAPPGRPIGSGPYRLVEHRRGRSYRFSANRAYFRGRPTVGRIVVPIIRTAQRTFRALERREVDMIPVSLSEDPARQLRGFGVRIRTGPSYLGTVLMLNTRSAPFNQPAVRTAVARALDLRRIARAVGQAVPADRGYLHPDSPWASSRDLQRSNVEAARVELRRTDLPPIRVLAPANDPVRLEAGRQVVLALQRAGATATLQELSRERLSRAVGEDAATPSYDAAIWSAPPLASYDPDFLGAVFGSGGDESPLNYSGYRSARFQALVERVSTATSEPARRGAVGDELRLLARDLPVVPLFFSEGAFAYRPSVYDGWVYVKGSGILDKRSFLPSSASERNGASPGAAGVEGEAEDDSVFLGLGWFGLVSIGLLGALLALAGAGLVARRR